MKAACRFSRCYVTRVFYCRLSLNFIKDWPYLARCEDGVSCSTFAHVGGFAAS
jgi:hypothetical protein